MKYKFNKWLLIPAIILTAVLSISNLAGLGIAYIFKDTQVNGAENETADTVSANKDSSSVSNSTPTYANGWDDAKDVSPIYCVGSVSKVYATAAVMQLVDAGKVELDGPVTDYLPEFRMADERYKDITVRMLMDHTSGIMGTTLTGDFLFSGADTYRHDNLLEILSTQRLKADPGSYAAYCNDGFDLLELIVEEVTGMTYTEYVQENLAKLTGGINTGTGVTALYEENLIPAFSSSNLHYENEAVMCLGAGGVYATAEDVANFGTGFFAGNEAILSENSKNEMAIRVSNDEYRDGSGLGWDYVNMPRYDAAGVKFLAKGGDVMLNHAFLGVAPEEKISIAVLSNGGSSSYNGMLAMDILDIILADRGIEVKDTDQPEIKVTDEIPASFDEYAGMYTSGNMRDGGAVVNVISFPDHKYMHVTTVTPFYADESDYMLTEDGVFVELAYKIENGNLGDVRIAKNPVKIKFVKNEDGKIYFAIDYQDTKVGLGQLERKEYVGEKMEANPISDEVRNSWQAVSGKDFMLYDDLEASRWYEAPKATVYTMDVADGYLYLNMSGFPRLLKIVDSTTAIAFQSIPSSANRDLIDIKLVRDENGLKLTTSTGLNCILVETIPELTTDIKTIELKTMEASWYRIGADMAEYEIVAERPEDSSVYVYNKYGEEVFTTHVVDASSRIPLPKDGYIVFLGKTGDSINIK